MVLLRQLLGDVLRRLRLRQGRTLREVSASARVSLGYLSEVERGQKEASSELLAAICGALNTPLSQVFREVSDNFALAELQNEPVLGIPRKPGLRSRGGQRRHELTVLNASMLRPDQHPGSDEETSLEFATTSLASSASGTCTRDQHVSLLLPVRSPTTCGNLSSS